jgi:farnesyl-diphosphate farnesyltransferase
MLPRGLADPVGLAYLLMRIVDTVEDAPELTGGQRADLLAALDAALAGTPGAVEPLSRAFGELPEERRLMLATPEVLARLAQLDSAYAEAVRTCARRMIAGVREFAQRSATRGLPYPAIHDAAELRSYCYYVAGVVGEMLCTMMAHYLRLPGLGQLREVAVELGIGLQLVNILKDALKDSRQNRRYLPMPQGRDVSHAEVYRAVLNEARHSLRTGVEFVLALPAQAAALRSFCGLPIAWGALTLVRAERDAGRARIGRGMVASSIRRFSKLAGDDQALRRWLVRLLRTPEPTGQ